MINTMALHALNTLLCIFYISIFIYSPLWKYNLGHSWVNVFIFDKICCKWFIFDKFFKHGR